ncbi:ATP-binding protein [Paenibacillus sp.]|uniref:ATP-binding protein n=1 Tax=Paenibacillus sp. TaxID=58172 RepID=UPI0028B10F76|nr:ATP-binding protein [Paenibacillus sp.]
MATSIEKQRRDYEYQLETAVEAAGRIITKSYLDQLEQYAIVEPSEEEIDIDIAECGQFYQLTKLVYNKDEHFLDKLTTIANVAYSINGSIASIIKSDGNSVNYYLGIISKNDRGRNENSLLRRQAASKAFQGAIQGNLIGSDVLTLDKEEVMELQQNIFSMGDQAVSSVSGIVALRDGDMKGMPSYVQGIENMVDSLRGQTYTIVLIADPLSNSELKVVKQGYELLHTQLSAYWRSSLIMNESDSTSLSQATSEGVSSGITKGIALTQSKSINKGDFAGGSAGLSFGIPNIGIGLNLGGSLGRTSSTGESSGETTSQSEMENTTRSSSSTSGTARSGGKSLQLHYENRSTKALLDKIDSQLERLEVCESFGAFNCAAYVIADDRNAAMTVSSNYNALMRGEASSIQASFINTWHKKTDVKRLLAYLNSFVHPRFCEQGQGMLEEPLQVTPASILNGNEIAIQIGLPKKSVAGISVIPMAPFGRNVRTAKGGRVLQLGSLYHMGKPDGSPVTLDVQSLAAHTFITGSTGSGKSNTIYQLLTKLEVQEVSFLVIEPAKGEYKHVFGSRPDVNVFGTNAKAAPLLRLNPFVFPSGIHVLEHIDRLIEIMNVCWPMYAAMPAVLKEAVEDAYTESGWDLESSENRYDNGFYPTFIDVMGSLQRVIERTAYADEVKSNYKGSLLTRVKSLTNGLNGQILCNGELDNGLLFDQNTIIDLSRVGSAETRSLIMGMLVMRLQEHRMHQGGMNMPLKHVTVLEEAHHLLKRTSGEQSMEGANLQGKSVEMLANAIAEMRTLGEGFIIADQSPGLLDAAAIRNTNTKIILQTPDMNDRQLVGRAANLNDEQIMELAKLSTGVAAVYQNNWLEPVLCSLEPFTAGGEVYTFVPEVQNSIVGAQYTQELLKLLLGKLLPEYPELDPEYLEVGLSHSRLSTKSKIMLYEIIGEYKETQQLQLWKQSEFARLASLVSDMMDGQAIMEQTRLAGVELQQLNGQLSEAISRRLGTIDEPLAHVISHCLMKHNSGRDDEGLKLYYLWEHMTRESIRG